MININYFFTNFLSSPLRHNGGLKVASFRKRNNLWQAQVRSKYVGSISKSFHSKSDAQKWAKEQEVLMRSGHRITFFDIY